SLPSRLRPDSDPDFRKSTVLILFPETTSQRLTFVTRSAWGSRRITVLPSGEKSTRDHAGDRRVCTTAPFASWIATLTTLFASVDGRQTTAKCLPSGLKATCCPFRPRLRVAFVVRLTWITSPLTYLTYTRVARSGLKANSAAPGSPRSTESTRSPVEGSYA